MGRQCSVCAHAKRSQIDRAIVDGESYRSVASRFALSDASVYRHAKAHIPEALAVAHDAELIAHGDDLLAQVASLRERALGLLDAAENAKDIRGAVAACREVRECIGLLAELAGKLDKSTKINILALGEWAEIRNLIGEIVEADPVARARLVEGLRAIEGRHARG